MDIQHDVELLPFNTFHVSARAAHLARFRSLDELRALLSAPELKGLPRLVMGGGSNMLFTRDWPGVVLLNEIEGITVVEENDDHVIVRSGSGVVWHEFVAHCVGEGWGGIENLSLIPGKVGATPMQNIGAYGVEIKDVFDHLEALRISDGEVVRFNAEECRFGYRESFFKHEGKNKYIILSVAFKLSKHPLVRTYYGSIKHELEQRGITAPTIQDVSDAVIHIRRSKLPDTHVLGNAGSFFKNPVVAAELAERIKATHPDLVSFPGDEGHVKLAAGWLIEQAGWKGFREADLGVHKDQALVLVNYGGSTGSAIFDLSTRVLESVKEKFGVELEREVNII
ncbi:MAG: UDP-N-acetylmuramate dehydrogenase [Flavobacteriales bacterium]|jgi:UDP-N-acetylmuramate dehydrogenase|nr:UDP-N-acetylmuramate dehydrogenase [Flavobacteriales bacterium]MBK6893624.1 UDP-N-acetylmuramate dehydrogenase [Flavobacteriales bacterium]MBK7248664.1 UDP-N-acetylmuramate dehydrogenase [Flavobacteriales bacterium]MBK7287560.1 UDP-N-acetylmuramate dehydrogenase [Flavobacteriales bacterium]MBK9059104.1 UDP-N-acetylmuramate dehydrogenase [Flavobacteriales bacterium]